MFLLPIHAKLPTGMDLDQSGLPVKFRRAEQNSCYDIKDSPIYI